MKWVLGTGRCGLHSYTAWKGGTIESNDPIRELAVKKYQDGLTKEENKYVLDFFRNRSNLNTPLITDCVQFMFMREILQVDPKAEFVWIVGEKAKVIEGFMSKVAEDKRIHPKGWDFNYNNKRKLLAWYYDEVNKIIEENLISLNKKFEKVLTKDIPVLVQK